jgi:CheY-like chemotaxis protein
VLVVDDDTDTANSLSMLVELWGHDVRRAYSAAVALEMTAAYQPDVLLLDIAMPGINGYQLAREIRRQACGKYSLLIAITGYAGAAHHLRGMEAGFDQYHTKPVDPATVKGLLLLEQRRLAEGPHPTAPMQRVQRGDEKASERGVLQVGMP